MDLSSHGAAADRRAHPRPHRAARRAFSVLELLVSIGVLFTLVGIMLPALHYATAIAGPLVQCQVNLKTLRESMSMHLNDANDELPTADYSGRAAGPGPHLRQILGPYGAADIRTWICPADHTPDHLQQTYGSYVYPPGVAMGMSKRRLRGIDLPQEYPVFADRRAFHRSNGISNETMLVPLYRGSTGGGGDPFGAFKLPVGCNAVFADHHISHEGYEPNQTAADPGEFRDPSL